MKKILTFLAFVLATVAWADTPTSCSNFGGLSSGCNACFTGSAQPYETEGITASDVYTNTSTNQYHYLWVGAGRFNVTIQELGGADWEMSQTSLDNMFEIPSYTGTSGGVPYIFYYPGESSTWIRTKSGQYFRFASHGTATSRTSPLFKIAYTVQVTPQSTSGVNGSTATHRECAFYYGRWCGDGVVDSDKGEQCDNGPSNGTGNCSSTCQNQTPVCNSLTVSATSTTNGGNVTYTCSGSNVTSYSVVLKKSNGDTVQTFSSATGTLTIPASPNETYTASCFVNGQSTTPTSCQKTITNTITTTPVCTGLTVSPTSVTNGGTITYSCTGNNVTSYSIVAKNPDGSTLTTSPNANGSITLPATPTGNYVVSCFVNGQTTTPSVCEKTVPNNTTTTPVCTGLTVSPMSLVNGGTVNYTCTGDNVTSYSVVFTSPSGSILQTLGTSTGSVSVPSVPLGTYNVKCFVNGQTITPSVCEKTFSNSTTSNPSCDNLSVSVSGNTASYSCTGSNVSSYSIALNGSQISTNASGSTTLSYGTHTFVCTVNGSITSSSCQKTVTISNNVYPQIRVIKDDSDNRDDQQQVNVGGVAQFSVVVSNPGQEALDTVNLTDQLAPECNRSSSETINMIANVGNRDTRLDPGESFSYICARSSVDQGTFPNNENRICVYGRGVTSGNTVNSCDTTRIYFGTIQPTTCQYLQVSQSGNQINASCGPNGSYRLFVLQGKQVVNTYQNPNGQFAFSLGDGSYKVACLRDGETGIQPACQKNITISTRSNTCTLSSSQRFGGAPLRTHLSCYSPDSSNCMIRISKDGAPWQVINTCSASMTLSQKGFYEATCFVDGIEEVTCSTDIRVDIMTIIETGPFLPTLIIVATGLAVYITYRRRKTV